MALFAAVFLALVIFAYPSWSGSVTLAARTVAIAGVLAALTLAASVLLRRRPGLGLIFLAGAIALIVVSWNQVRAVADANILTAAIESAGEENVMDVLSTTSTKVGSFIREVIGVRDRVVVEIVPLFEELWDNQVADIITGPDAEDTDRLADASATVDRLVAHVGAARMSIEEAFEAALDELAALEGAIPDDVRRSILVVAADQLNLDRDANLRMLDLATARLDAARSAVTLLANNPGIYRFDPAGQEIVFLPGGAIATGTARQYRAASDAIESSGEEAAVIARGRDRARIAEVLALTEAARTAH